MISEVISAVIAAVIGNYMTSFFVLGVIVGLVQIARHRGPRTAAVVSGLLLNTFIFYAIGCAMALNFVMHSVFGDYAAQTIGWAQSPFQLELAFSSLGIAVIAFIVYGKRSQLRSKVALILAMAVFGYGASGGHVYQMVVNRDYAANNTGLLLVMDLFIPTFALVVLIWHVVASRRNEDPTDLPVDSAAAVPASSASVAG